MVRSVDEVNQYQRAYLAWPILTAAASLKGGTLTYKEVADGIGIHHRALRFVLGKIQDHCLDEKLPPLTILVVNQGTKRPGEGFIAWDVDDLDEGYDRVYGYAWEQLPNPFAFASAGETLDELADHLVRAPHDSAAVYEKVRNRGIAQDVFRRALLKAYQGRCAFCNLSFETALQAAHIIPWADASIEERMSPTNGLLLCATHHALFDSHILTVTTTCKIRCSIEKPRARNWTDVDRQSTISLHGQGVSLPSDPRLHPSVAALRHRLRRR
jgi:putative restriction endonuclease